MNRASCRETEGKPDWGGGLYEGDRMDKPITTAKSY